MGGVVSSAQGDAGTEWEDGKLSRDTRVNTTANTKAVQGIHTPRWRKIELAARKEQAGQVGFHSVVESRDFKQLEAPYMIAADYTVGEGKKKASGKNPVALEAVHEDGAPRGILNGPDDEKPERTPSASSTAASTASHFESLKESSDHVTLGGKDEWGKKKRGTMRSERSHGGMASDDGGFWAAPWKFMRLGRGSDAGRDTAASSRPLPLPSSNPSTPRPTGILRGSTKPTHIQGQKSETPPLQSPADPDRLEARSPVSSTTSPRPDQAHIPEVTEDRKVLVKAGRLTRTLSNESFPSSDAEGDRGGGASPISKGSPVLFMRGASSPTKPIATFAGSSSNLVSRTQSATVSAEEATVAEKPVRKPTRVATRQAPKKDGGSSPIIGLRPASKADDSMHLEDLNETDLAPASSKHIKEPDNQMTDPSNIPERASAETSAEEQDDPARVQNPAAESSGVPVEGDAPVDARKKRSTGKNLGWGDKKAPPLNYKPWYYIW